MLAEYIWNFLPLPFNFVILIIVIVFGWLLLAGIIDQIGKYARNRQQIDLKRELLDRGLDADEIKTIMDAGPVETDDDDE